MPLLEEFTRNGIWFFRWRSYLPLALLPLIVLAMSQSEYIPHHETLDTWWEFICLAVSMAGLGIRVATVGYAPGGTSGRNTKGQEAAVLNTTGMYSTVRHPLYVANFVITLGILLFPGSWWLVTICVLAFFLYYERIMFAEEEYLRKKFGDAYVEWASRTPVFVPDPRRWRRPALPFSLRTVLRREYSGFLSIILFLFLMEVVGDLFTKRRVELDTHWAVLLAVGFSVWVTLRTIKKKTRWLSVEGR